MSLSWLWLVVLPCANAQPPYTMTKEGPGIDPLRFNTFALKHCDDSLAGGPESKTVAVVIRGESFRGLSHGMNIRGSKSPWNCRAESYAIQKALARNQVRSLILPFENAGLNVDVFLSTYECPAPSDLARHNVSAAKQIAGWYGGLREDGGRVVSARFHPPRHGRQNTPVAEAMAMLREHWTLQGYRAVIMWRFDLAILEPPQKCSSEDCHAWDNFVELSATRLYKVNDDWAHSIPGAHLKCGIPILESGCMLGGMYSPLCNKLLAETFAQSFAPDSKMSLAKAKDLFMENLSQNSGNFVVYRSNFQTGNTEGKLACEVLERLDAGPACPASSKEGQLVACRVVFDLYHQLHVHHRKPTDSQALFAEMGNDGIWNQWGGGFCGKHQDEVLLTHEPTVDWTTYPKIENHERRLFLDSRHTLR